MMKRKQNHRYSEYIKQSILYQNKIKEYKYVMENLVKKEKKHKTNIKLLNYRKSEPLSGNLDLDVQFKQSLDEK